MTADLSSPLDAFEHDELLFEAGHVLASKYVLERPAGFGGMAALWVATNRSTGAEVCVKLLIPGEEGTEAVERFRREAHAAAILNHRAIVRVFDLLELDENGETTKARPRAYAIVMELLHGETLGDHLAKRGKIPLDEALELFLPVVSALGHAHRAGVIHRDIKPDNIFLSRDPDGPVIPKVLDFGVSKLSNAEAITMDGVLVGTPSFMSPEQAKGARELDARSDVFSAGILFYTMLTGKNPFEDALSFASAVEAVVQNPVPPIDGLPPEIWAVIDRSIAKNPAARFSDATEMSIALRKASGRRATTESNAAIPVAMPSGIQHAPFVGGEGVSADDSSMPAPSGTAGRGRALVVGVVGLCAALLVAASIATIVSKPSSPKSVEPSAKPITTLESHSAAAPVEPPPSTAPPPSSGEVRSAVTEAAPVAKAPAPPPARSAAPKHPPAPSSTRKPGDEPQNARDPGF